MAVSAGNYGAAPHVVVAAAYVDTSGALTRAGPVQTAVVTADLPTTDPHLKGALWSNAGVWTISQG